MLEYKRRRRPTCWRKDFNVAPEKNNDECDVPPSQYLRVMYAHEQFFLSDFVNVISNKHLLSARLEPIIVEKNLKIIAHVVIMIVLGMDLLEMYELKPCYKSRVQAKRNNLFHSPLTVSL